MKARCARRLYLSIVFLLSACVSSKPTMSLGAQDDDSQLWQAQQIDDYSFVVQRRCFCLPDYVRPIRVRVEGGKITDARYADNDKIVTTQVRKELRTMDQWLEYTQALEADKPHRLQVKLDAEQGYLLRLDLDRSQRIADDELTVLITEFKAH